MAHSEGTSLSYYRRRIPLTMVALQTKQWEHIYLERRKQFRKDLTEHTFQTGLPFWPPFPRGMVLDCAEPP